jgi:hypothetical protein
MANTEEEGRSLSCADLNKELPGPMHRCQEATDGELYSNQHLLIGLQEVILPLSSYQAPSSSFYRLLRGVQHPN